MMEVGIINVITLSDMRWSYCDMSISLSRNIMSKHESYKKEKDKAILYPGDHVME